MIVLVTQQFLFERGHEPSNELLVYTSEACELANAVLLQIMYQLPDR